MKKFIHRLILLLFVFFTCFWGTYFIWEPHYIVVYGPSMWPNVTSGDYCLSIGKFSEIKRGEVVGVRYKNLLLMKRVIGVPGDVIHIIQGNVFINNVREDTTELIFKHTVDEPDLFFIHLKPNEYFIMGDNRSNSMDSRYFGPVKREDIVEKVILRWHRLDPTRFTRED